MKTKITTRQKVITVAGITVVSTLVSTILAKHYFAQSILTALFFYLITGERPTIVYAQIKTIPRDFM